MKRNRGRFRPSRAILSLLIIRQNGLCYYGPHPIFIDAESSRKKASFDHKLPIWRGGELWGDNVVAACRFCNGRKGPLDAEQFLNLRHDEQRLKQVVRLVHKEMEKLDLQRPRPTRRTVQESKQRLVDALRPIIEQLTAAGMAESVDAADLKSAAFEA